MTEKEHHHHHQERNVSRVHNSRAPLPPPSTLAQIGIQIKYEFLNYLRSRRFLILLAIDGIIGAIFTTVVAYYRDPIYMVSTLSFYYYWWGDTSTYVVVLCAVFLGGDAIAAEFQSKTGYYLIPNPIKRSTIYIGKWIAAFGASSIIIGIAVAIAVGNGVLYHGSKNIPYQFGESLLFSWIYLVSMLGFVFAFSSLFKNAVYSIVVAGAVFLFGFRLLSDFASRLAHIEPWFILTYGGSIVGNILNPAGYPAHAVITKGIEPGSPSFITFNSTVPEGLVIMLVYFLAMTLAGLVLFQRKEFT